jgi:metallothionein
MSVQVTMVKCACSDCICVIDTSKAVEKDQRLYCSEECSNHHQGGVGCHHAGCECHG